MSNRLQYETSPYLQQHKDNPVDWYPWGTEAFAKAAEENKPVFLSIGYSTCHWCHVMARESFENRTIADYLNEHFVCVKVDREERPDIDSVYMQAVLAYTGQGGWPMSVFLTPDKKPFFAGTYFPVRSTQNTPGFFDLIRAIGMQWEHDPEALLNSAEELTEHVTRMAEQSVSVGDVPLEEARLLPDLGAAMFQGMYDPEFGGFGQAPKFPTPHNLIFLLAYGALKEEETSKAMAEYTLVQMRKGGIFDQVGGGFSRYSTDPYFLAPHFEKMLYDNALLIMAYSAAYEVTKNSFYKTVAKETADYVMRELRSPDGTFYSAQDADSDGEEGKFYTFTYEEVLQVLGAVRGADFAESYGVIEEGNFQMNTNILNLLHFTQDDPQELLTLKNLFQPDLEAFMAYRKERTELHTDTKVLVSLNALMVTALALLGRALRPTQPEPAVFYLKTAENALKKLLDLAEKKQAENALFLDDAAFLTTALLELYNTTLEENYLTLSQTWANRTVETFGRKAEDGELEGFTLSAAGQTELFLNPTETYDGAIPSGNSVMAYNLVRLSQLVEEEDLEQKAEEQLTFLAACSREHPAGHAMYLLAQLLYDNPPVHVSVVPGPEFDKNSLFTDLPFLSNTVLEDGDVNRLKDGKTTYYVCKGTVCLPPTNTLAV